ncbi:MULTISPECIES: M48 family metallopeptidase [Acidobacteriaceae]|uniref:M48 family metallopeptidase n=1 Tax=Acidobacteriaceae TaxID=204434 RepID=UPI00131E7377|nr:MULTISPECIES: M48 family metallopeptidase [Acidobacteriaceae]MDW5264748.1 M48 family metallopeptidase [Edaphobacter sp.]
MRLRTILLLLVALAALLTAPQWVKSTTVTEAQALHVAAQDQTAYTLPPAKLKQAEGLFRVRTILYFVGSVWSILQLLLLLALGVPPRLRDIAVRAAENRLAQCFLFTLLLFGAIAVLDAPLYVYGHHLGLAYGLSVQHWPSWLWDQVKSFVMVWIVGGMLVMVLFWVIRRSPGRWWLWFWMPAMVAVLFGVFLAPVLVDPLFNKFEPLQQSNPALVAQLEKVVARSGISLPPDRMFYMRASSKVTGLNAYVTGFGPSKRLVLWDTTIKDATPDELSSVFGHELGHYALHHIALGLVFTGLLLLVAFFVGQKLTEWLLRRYGARWGIGSQNDWAFLVVLLLALNTLSFFLAPIENAFSRSIEHAADVYGQEAVHGIVADPQAVTQQAFQRLGEASLEDPVAHPFIEFWTYSHPSIESRAAFAATYNPWVIGEHPKFFPKDRNAIF